jgi:hypothetical protein
VREPPDPHYWTPIFFVQGVGWEKTSIGSIRRIDRDPGTVFHLAIVFSVHQSVVEDREILIVDTGTGLECGYSPERIPSYPLVARVNRHQVTYER